MMISAAMCSAFKLRCIPRNTVLGAGLTSTIYNLHKSDYDVNSLAIVRLGRASIAVIDVAITYKQGLYYRKWDETSPEYKLEKSRVHKIAAEKLLQMICANKGVYIKVGQHIGGLEYLLPPEYVQTMKVLHSNAPENPIEDLYKVIRADLKKSPDEIFDSFELHPLGTASLAQVHKATLKTGEVVAVKVQHPYVKNNCKVDMKTMEILVNIMSRVFPDFKIQWLVSESKKNIKVELDFLNEGKNAEKLALQFKNYSWLRIPKIYWNLSTPRILVMEYLEGGQVTDLNYIRKHQIDPFEIANKIGQLYSEMIFKTGFVHSDPHPGNILVNKTAGGNVDIVLLDHGLYANLTEKFRCNYSKLWLSILNTDQKGMKEHSQNLGIKGNLYGLFACMVSGRPWDTLMKGIVEVKYTTEEKNTLQSNTSKVLPQITDVLEQVDKQMLLILKTNDLIRGIEATLQTQNRMTAFWVMSKCCVQSVYAERRHHKMNMITRFGLMARENWEIFKLNVFFLFLAVRSFAFRTTLKNLL